MFSVLPQHKHVALASSLVGLSISSNKEALPQHGVDTALLIRGRLQRGAFVRPQQASSLPQVCVLQVCYVQHPAQQQAPGCFVHINITRLLLLKPRRPLTRLDVHSNTAEGLLLQYPLAVTGDDTRERTLLAVGRQRHTSWSMFLWLMVLLHSWSRCMSRPIC